MTAPSFEYTLGLKASTREDLSWLIASAAAGFSVPGIAGVSELQPMSPERVRAMLGVPSDAAPVEEHSTVAEPGLEAIVPEREQAVTGNTEQAVTGNTEQAKRKRRTKAEMEAVRAAEEAAKQTPAAPSEAAVNEDEPDLFGGLSDEPKPAEPYAVVDMDGRVHELLASPEAWYDVLKGMFEGANKHADLVALAKANTASGVVQRLRAEGQERIVLALQEIASDRMKTLKQAEEAAAAKPAESAAEITLETVRGSIQKLVETKGGDTALAFMQSEFGVRRAGDIPKERYAEFLRKCAAKVAE